MREAHLDAFPVPVRASVESEAQADLEWVRRLDSAQALDAVLQVCAFVYSLDDDARNIAIDWIFAGGKVTPRMVRQRGTQRNRLEAKVMRTGIVDFVAKLKTEVAKSAKVLSTNPQSAQRTPS